ncbi:hypothetical protein V202x_30010 [Gimesia aquarii]|uniref:Uncharacterized protein n=1 Tax=Gimesia aquarii TaxID=2527964 RepID=A0A517WWH7_9PLAN|nr:hypothetical protein V202x_30010 [Gimesia aquarii]
MTYNSKDKLNTFHLTGSLGVSVLLALLTGSWVVFLVMSFLLVGSSLLTGEIRIPDHRYKR